MNLKKQIASYSKIKTWTVIPFSLLAILSIVVFVGATIFSEFIEVPAKVMLFSATGMISGIVIPILSLTCLENKRKKLLDIDIFEYLKILSEQQITEKYVYYDLIDVIFSSVRTKYLKEGNNSKNQQVTNVLNKILMEDSKNGLANKFVYSKWKKFGELCKYIISQYNVDNINFEGNVYSIYKQLKQQNSDNKDAFKPINIERITKVAVLIGCIFTYPFYKFNYWIFNLAAIILLAIEIKSANNK